MTTVMMTRRTVWGHPAMASRTVFHIRELSAFISSPLLPVAGRRCRAGWRRAPQTSCGRHHVASELGEVLRFAVAFLGMAFLAFFDAPECCASVALALRFFAFVWSPAPDFAFGLAFALRRLRISACALACIARRSAVLNASLRE